MVSLIEKSPCEGLLPVTVAGAELAEILPGQITAIAPFNGQERAVSAALKSLGLSFPAPGRAVSKGVASCIWTARGQAFLLGVAPPPALSEIAALSDQSDGWACLRLEGAMADAVLARLVPLDLRVAAFKKGHTARSLLGHMPLIVTRVGATAFEMMVFRSMAGSAVHELHRVMQAVAARG